MALDAVDQLDESSVAREKLITAVELSMSTLDKREISVASRLPEQISSGQGSFYASVPAAQKAFDQSLTGISHITLHVLA